MLREGVEKGGGVGQTRDNTRTLGLCSQRRDTRGDLDELAALVTVTVRTGLVMGYRTLMMTQHSSTQFLVPYSHSSTRLQYSLLL